MAKNHKPPDLTGKPVLILSGEFSGHEGICLGPGNEAGLWAVSPDTSDKILYLRFEEEFGILINKGQEPELN